MSYYSRKAVAPIGPKRGRGEMRPTSDYGGTSPTTGWRPGSGRDIRQKQMDKRQKRADDKEAWDLSSEARRIVEKYWPYRTNAYVGSADAELRFPKDKENPMEWWKDLARLVHIERKLKMGSQERAIARSSGDRLFKTIMDHCIVCGTPPHHRPYPTRFLAIEFKKESLAVRFPFPPTNPCHSTTVCADCGPTFGFTHKAQKKEVKLGPFTVELSYYDLTVLDGPPTEWEKSLPKSIPIHIDDPDDPEKDFMDSP